MASTLVVGSQVINKLLQTGDYNFIKVNGLDETYFHGFENEFNFINEHYKKYGKIPDTMTFLEKFQDFGLYEVNETDDYLLDRLYEENAYYKIRPVLNEANNKLKEDARLAYNYLKDTFDSIRPHTVVKSKDIIDDAMERYEEYMTRNTSEVAMTISSGMPELDEIFGGWEFGEELVTLVARTNQGKCLCKGTKVLMADGTLTNIEDIKIGNKVQSYGRVNTVLALHNGKSKGYKIKADYGSYIVSENHILTLWNTVSQEIQDILIEDFLKINYKPLCEEYLGIRVINQDFIKFYPIEISEIEEIEYYGFECDGDHRFILGDGTLTHNSWILMKFLAEAWKQGYRVGLYSGEMSPNKLGYRFDALFGHYSNRALVRGIQVDGYKNYIESLNNDNGACFKIATKEDFGGTPTVQHIRNFVEENKIQIMGIDQLSLMADGRASRNDPPRMRLSHIAEDLFSLSTEYKIPILALAQANRAGINKDDENDAPGLENIKESDDIAHNSSKCIGMRQNKGRLIMDIIKNREGRVGEKLEYAWQIDTGTFDYIPTTGDAANPEIRQVTTQAVKAVNMDKILSNPF